MAGKSFSYLNGTEIIVRVQGIDVMECQSITFQEQVSNQLMFGMGGYSAITNEPLQVTGLGGSLRVLRYTTRDVNALKGKPALGKNPAALNYNVELKHTEKSLDLIANSSPEIADGNSLAFTTSFSPVQLLLEKTFDIEIWLRSGDSTKQRHLIHTLQNCIMGGYSIGFNAGAVSTEDYTFICTAIIDNDTGAQV